MTRCAAMAIAARAGTAVRWGMRQKAPLSMRLVNRADRLAGALIVPGVNHVLPLVARAGHGRGHRLVRNITYCDVPSGPLRLDLYLPPGDGPHPVLAGFHGGAWTLGRKENIGHQAAAFARAGFLTAVVQYRLAPQHRWPACAEDVATALVWLRREAEGWGGDAGRVGVFGDSAGGHLSAWAAVAPAPVGLELPVVAAAVHWYGVFDFPRFAGVRYHRMPQIMRNLFGPDWTSSGQPEAASPIRHLTADRPVPPSLLHVGTFDPLLGQSRRYAEALAAAGHDARLLEYRGGVHGFANLWWQADARAAMRSSIEWFGRHLVR